QELGFPSSILPKSLFAKASFPPFLSSLLRPLPFHPTVICLPLSSRVRKHHYHVFHLSITIPPLPLIVLELLSILQKRVWLKGGGIDMTPSILDSASLRVCSRRSFGGMRRCVAGSVGGVTA
ncbi:hypothetical protein V8G54_009224, partial [Vigna mungo]